MFIKVYLLEELLSPLITPFVLCFSLRHKSLEIVDFFRSFTVDVVGVGDVCAFAQLDVRKKSEKDKSASEVIFYLCIGFICLMYFSLELGNIVFLICH